MKRSSPSIFSLQLILLLYIFWYPQSPYKGSMALPRENLIRETAKMLGYARSGTNVVSILSDGIEHALQQGRICEDQTGYLTLKV